MVRGNYHANLARAEAAVLGGLQYKLWHGPLKIVTLQKVLS